MLRARHRLAMLAGLASIGAVVVVVAKQAERVRVAVQEKPVAPDEPRAPRRSAPATTLDGSRAAQPGVVVERAGIVAPPFRVKVVDGNGGPCSHVRIRVEATAPKTSRFYGRHLDLESGPSYGEALIDVADLVQERIQEWTLWTSEERESLHAQLVEDWEGLDPPRGDLGDEVIGRFVEKELVDREPWVVRLRVPASDPPASIFDPFTPPESPLVLKLPEIGSMTVTFVGRNGEIVDADIAVRLLAWSKPQPPLEPASASDAPAVYEDMLDAAEGRLDLPHVAPGMQFWLDGIARRRDPGFAWSDVSAWSLLEASDQEMLRAYRSGTGRDPATEPRFGIQLDGPTHAGDHVDHVIPLQIGPVRFTGSIEDLRGEPVRWARVTLRARVPTQDLRSLASSAPPAVIETTTDATGRFEESFPVFGTLEPGIPTELAITHVGRLVVTKGVGATSSDQRSVDFGVIALPAE